MKGVVLLLPVLLQSLKVEGFKNVLISTRMITRGSSSLAIHRLSSVCRALSTVINTEVSSFFFYIFSIDYTNPSSHSRVYTYPAKQALTPRRLQPLNSLYPALLALIVRLVSVATLPR